MYDTILKYLDKSKISLYNIVINLDDNIVYNKNTLWNDIFIDNDMKNIINIFYDKYYLYSSFDFSLIDKYIKLDNKINNLIKRLLLAIFDYYSDKDKKFFIDNEGSILYLSILLYLSIKLYDIDYNKIDDVKKLEKFINNIIDNFVNIRFRKSRDLDKLNNNIKKYIIDNNLFNSNVNNLNRSISKNTFIKVNKYSNLYITNYEYDINELNSYEEKDISIVNKELNIKDKFINISYDLLFYTVFKSLKSGLDYNFLFKFNKKLFDNKKLIDNISNINPINNKIILLFDYDDIKNNYELINTLNDINRNVYIIVNGSDVTNNYNMFMGIKNIIVEEEFLNKNEKYLEIWKDMEINFIIKDYSNKINELDLIKGK